MGEGETSLKCNLPWFQLLSTNLSWQAEYIEFVCAAECVAQSTGKWGENHKFPLALEQLAKQISPDSLCPINPHKGRHRG